MALHIIYFLIALAYGLWILSLILKEKILALFSVILMFPLSIYIFVEGIDIFQWNNILVIVFGAVTFAIAAYTGMKVTLETMEENY